MTADPAVAERPAVRAPLVPRLRRARLPFVNLAASIVISAAVLYVAFFPVAGLPALGPAFNPSTGAWTMAADAEVTDRTLELHEGGKLFTGADANEFVDQFADGKKMVCPFSRLRNCTSG